MRARLTLWLVALGLCLFVSTAGFGQEPNNNSSPKDGDKCKVTAGPNKGKVGKYTDDATWCEGDWGSTECKDQQGNSKCSSAAQTGGLSPKDVAIVRGYLEASSDSNPSGLTKWETKYKAKAVKDENGVTITLPGNRHLVFDGELKKLDKALKKQ